jgi:hypothetical protein
MAEPQGAPLGWRWQCFRRSFPPSGQQQLQGHHRQSAETECCRAVASTYTAENIQGFVAQRALLLKTFAKRNNGISGSAGGALSNEKQLNRGTVRLNTTDHHAEPIVDFNTLINPVDADIIVESLKFARKYYATDAMKQLLPSETSPGVNITSDEDLAAFVGRSMGSTTAHSSGTAAMAPRHLAGVVSPELLVYGVTGLSIGDISLIPMIPATHNLCDDVCGCGEGGRFDQGETK